MKRRIKKSQFDNLDAMRFLAFLAIFSSLAVYSNDELVKGSNFYSDLSIFTRRIAETAMSLTFIIASFLNSWAVFEERFIYKKLNLPRFYVRRLLTIVPVYLLVGILAFVVLPKVDLGLIDDNHKLVGTGYYFSFLTNYSNFNLVEPYSSIAGNMWSIAVYIQFIVIWPLLLRSFRRNEKILFTITGLIFCISAWFYSNQASFLYSFLNTLADFTIGSILAYISFYKIDFYQKLKTVTPRTIGTVYILFFASFFIYNNLWTNHFEIPENGIFILRRLAYGFTLAFFIFEQNFISKSVFKLTRMKIFDAPGRMVYGLYAYHALAIVIALIIVDFMGFPASVSTYIILPILSLGITFILALFSNEFIEKRFLKQKKNYQPTREYTPVILTNENQTKPS